MHNRRFPKRNLIYAALVLFILSLVSSYYFKTNPSIKNDVEELENYVQKQEADVNLLIRDTALMRKLIFNRQNLEEFHRVEKKAYGFFLYAETLSDQNELLFWNSQKVLPPNDYGLTEGVSFQLLRNGYYVVVKKRVQFTGLNSNIIAYALIPVFYSYNVISAYLPKQFAHNKMADNKISLAPSKTQYAIHSLNNEPLFYVARKAHSPVASIDALTLILRFGGLLLLLVYLQFFAETLVQRKGAVIGTVFLGLGLVIGRVLLFTYPQFFHLRQFDLFDPTIYSNNWLNRSLGDLLINATVFCWIALFAWQNFGAAKHIPVYLRGYRIYLAAVPALFILILSTFEFADIVRSLVADSKISFNVTEFFGLNVYSFVGFVVLALLSLTYYYFVRLLFRVIIPAFKNRWVIVYFIIATIGLFYLTLKTGDSIVLFHLPVLLWLVIYTFLLSQERFIINRFKITMAGVLFWIFVFSISLSAIILQENKLKERQSRQTLAEKRYERSEPSQERTLSIALQYLDNDFLLGNFYRFQDQQASRILRDSIINYNYSIGYRNSYSAKIFVFDSSGNALFNDEQRSLADLDNIYYLQSKNTAIPGMRFFEASYNNITYITKRNIENDSTTLGYFFVISTPAKYDAKVLFPELFQRSEADRQEMQYPYAIYRGGRLQDASTKYPFKINLTPAEIPEREYTYKGNGENDELWYKASSNKVIVIVKKKETFIESITLFSYLFCAFLFMVGLIQLISYLLKWVYGWRLSTIFQQISIRSQIHGTIIFVSILSFLIIGGATISFFVSRNNRNNVERHSRTSEVLVRELEKRVKEKGSFKEVLTTADTASATRLQRLVQDVAEIHDVGVNLYDTFGNLMVSSNANYYRWGIFNNKMHPQAYFYLSRMRQVQRVQEESLSSLRYLSMYAAVRDDTGNVCAYSNIPYFLSQIELNEEISNFLVTIINLNAFILLIAGVIALFITNRITRSFSIISDKMKEVRLGKTNEAIEWNYKDEIGELVGQYNKMVQQLEQSAEALAKSEREGAWREMARQVAHEIKNPLTPMKLSIQYLQRAIQNNNSNVKELTSNVANTLIEQIDHLSKIAADFSRFANIGIKNVELFDLHQVLASLVDLYNSNPKVQIQWIKVESDLLMEADRTHMNRLFTNLLANAVDACAENEKCIIHIYERLEEGSVLIQVRDNGEGITEEMQSKIFVPNFTTKTSGTGLGLAMCKSIVEQANGTIWFETEVGKGTTFFVRLPVTG